MLYFISKDMVSFKSFFISVGIFCILGMMSGCSKKNVSSGLRTLTGPFKNIIIDKELRMTGPCEPSISINPKDPRIIVAGSVLDNVYTSRDGGKTWDYKRLQSGFGVYGDPVVRFGIHGEVYYSHLANSKGLAYRSEEFLDRIVVQKSLDSGKTWTDGTYPACNHKKDHDKQWLAIHPTTGEVAMTWTEFDVYGSKDEHDRSKLLFSISKDQGNHWTEAMVISDTSGDCLDDDGTVEGGHAAFDLDGNILAVWQHDEKIYLDRSEDGGKTWGKDTVIADQKGGWSYSISGLKRCNGFPTIKVDHSKGRNRGNIYVQWSAQPEGTNDTDVFVMVSSNGGKSWSSPMNIRALQSKGHQFLSWMDIDQTTGYIYLVYYDMKENTGGPVHVWLAYSVDGGTSFEHLEISETPFTLSPNVFFGDYNDISVVNGVVRPIWTRQDGNKLSVYTALINHKL